MLSQTVEYALRAMIHLAGAEAGAPARSELIAARTRVSPGYMSKVLRDLVVAGLVTSQRGRGGGFVLARGPDRITMLDVVNAVDPIQRIVRCPLNNPGHLELCPLHRRLDAALDLVERQFRETTLAAIVTSGRSVPGTCDALTRPTVRGAPLDRGTR